MANLGFMEEEIYEYDSSEEAYPDKVSTLVDEKEELTQTCHDLQRKLALADQEKNELVFEIETLTDQLAKARQKQPQQQPKSKYEVENNKLTEQLDKLKITNFQFETDLANEKLKFDDLSKELSGLTSAAELRLQEVVMVKDEIMLLKESLDRSALIINSFEKKIDEMTLVQITLEEQNAQLHQENIKLEEDMKALIKNTADCLERERAMREVDRRDEYRPQVNNPLLPYRQTFDAVRNTMSMFQWSRLTIAPRES